MTHKTSTDGNSALQFQIGHIYFYGYAGLNPGLVEAHLPVRPGETVDINSFDRERNLIRKTVVAETGRPPSDVAVVCCDRDHHLLIYIGLRGASSRKLPLRKAPAGNNSLKGDELQLYKAYLAAFAKAVESGAGGRTVPGDMHS